jgi:hypothetical protein
MKPWDEGNGDQDWDRITLPVHFCACTVCVAGLANSVTGQGRSCRKFVFVYGKLGLSNMTGRVKDCHEYGAGVWQS